jgi:hypothetical protein
MKSTEFRPGGAAKVPTSERKRILNRLSSLTLLGAVAWAAPGALPHQQVVGDWLSDGLTRLGSSFVLDAQPEAQLRRHRPPVDIADDTSLINQQPTKGNTQ